MDMHATSPQKENTLFSEVQAGLPPYLPVNRASQQGNEHVAFCSLCCVEVSVAHGGVNDLKNYITLTFSTQCIAYSVCLKLPTLWGSASVKSY